MIWINIMKFMQVAEIWYIVRLDLQSKDKSQT